MCPFNQSKNETPRVAVLGKKDSRREQSAPKRAAWKRWETSSPLPPRTLPINADVSTTCSVQEKEEEEEEEQEEEELLPPLWQAGNPEESER